MKIWYNVSVDSLDHPSLFDPPGQDSLHLRPARGSLLVDEDGYSPGEPLFSAVPLVNAPPDLERSGCLR